MTDRVATARAYYRHVDRGAYEALEALLSPEFVHERPDRTLDGRKTFVSFMRDDRPMTDTTHAVDVVYTDGDSGEVAVRGRLLRNDESLFEFVDVFAFEDGAVSRLRTYTR